MLNEWSWGERKRVKPILEELIFVLIVRLINQLLFLILKFNQNHFFNYKQKMRKL